MSAKLEKETWTDLIYNGLLETDGQEAADKWADDFCRRATQRIEKLWGEIDSIHRYGQERLAEAERTEAKKA